MNWKKGITTVILLIILVGGGYWAYLQFLAPKPNNGEQTAPATPQPVETEVEVVSAEAELQPVRFANLSVLVPGRVAEVLVKEGEVVQSGQPLLRLVAADLEATLAQAEAGVEQASAGIVAANAQLEAAQVGLQAAQATLDTAQAQLALVQADPSSEEIAALQSNIAVAEAIINQAAANRNAAIEGATAAQIQAAQAQLAASLAQERVAQDQYDTLINNEIFGTLEEQARFALEAAKAATAAAQAALSELQSGPTAVQQAAAQSAVSVAIAQRDAAQAQLDLLLAGARSEQVAITQTQVAQAEVGLSQAEAAIAQTEAAVAQAEAAFKQAEASRAAAQAMLDKMVVSAAFAGTITHIHTEQGETVSPGLPVITLADFSSWLVKTTDLTEIDIVTVGIGDQANIRIEAIPDQILDGTVIEIASFSTLTRGDVTYEVTIALDATQNLPLRWGMTVFADLLVGE